MVNRVQTLRSSTAGSRPTGRSPGELYVNFPDNALGVANAAGTSFDLLAVRFHSTLASYSIGDYVVQGGVLYRATSSSVPGAFVPGNWSKVMAQADLTAAYLPLAGGTLTGSLVVNPATAGAYVTLNPTAASQQAMVNLSQSGAGKWQLGKQTDDSFILYDSVAPGNVITIPSNGTTITFSRGLILPANPSAALGAATKQYVDSADAGKVNDTGDTMTGPLVLPAGSAAATSLNFGTAGTGIYGFSATRMDFAAGGGNRLALTNVAMQPLVPMQMTDGAVGAPPISFGNEPSSGFYRAAAGDVRLAMGGADAVKFLTTGKTTTFSGEVLLANSTPSTALAAASKGYVDGIASGSAITKVVAQMFSSTGTYTPTAGMLYAMVEVVGGGGGGGGMANSAAGNQGGGGGGGGGAYAKAIMTAATIGASVVVTIGGGGAPGTTSGTVGGNGSSTTFGSLLGIGAGQGGAAGAASSNTSPGGLGGTGVSGTVTPVITAGGEDGADGWQATIVTVGMTGGDGGAAGQGWGMGGRGGRAVNGGGGRLYGGGGAGGHSVIATGAHAGGVGAAGVVLITEYCH